MCVVILLMGKTGDAYNIKGETFILFRKFQSFVSERHDKNSMAKCEETQILTLIVGTVLERKGPGNRFNLPSQTFRTLLETHNQS